MSNFSDGSRFATGKNLLIPKILVAIIFCLIGFQYLSFMQVNEKPMLERRLSLFRLETSYADGSKPSPVGYRSLFSPFPEEFRHAISSAVLDHFDECCGNSTTLSKCPLVPPGLHGPIKVTMPEEVASLERASSFFPWLSPGGRHCPGNCLARHKVAIIVPYRDRMEHLPALLYNLHSLLPRQQLEYGIYVVEQHGSNEPFNRAMLFNVGAAEALKQHEYQCFVFHDVDLLPEDDRNIYNCPAQPRHMSVAIDTFSYRLPYDTIFGGVSAMTVDHFRLVNGFSNKFWGWGGEDDDMSNRLRIKKLYVSRYPANVARYKMLKHAKVKANNERFKFLYSGTKRIDSDGYSSLKYKIVNMQLKRLYTWLIVDLPRL